VDPIRPNREIDPTARPALALAIDFGYQEIAILLLEDPRVDPSINHNHALHLACSTGCVEVVRLLLNDSRVNPSDLDNEALLRAVKSSNYAIVRLLMDYGNLIF
jgi:ankyrin repeat protein